MFTQNDLGSIATIQMTRPWDAVIREPEVSVAVASEKSQLLLRTFLPMLWHKRFSAVREIRQERQRRAEFSYHYIAIPNRHRMVDHGNGEYASEVTAELLRPKFPLLA